MTPADRLAHLLDEWSLTADGFASNATGPSELAKWLAARGVRVSVPAAPNCPKCGERMRWSGNDGSDINGWFCNAGHEIVVRLPAQRVVSPTDHDESLISPLCTHVAPRLVLRCLDCDDALRAAVRAAPPDPDLRARVKAMLDEMLEWAKSSVRGTDWGNGFCQAVAEMRGRLDSVLARAALTEHPQPSETR